MPLVYTKTIVPGSMLGVWQATEDTETLLGELDLDPEDEKSYSSIRNRNRKLQWLGCRVALAHLLQTPKIGIRYTEYGKPLLISSQAHISFTHSGSFAAAICSSTANVGIDLEQVREKISRVAERFLTPQELMLASVADRLEILTLFWAVKETLYKINEKPDIDIQHDISIESFDYLCAINGELKAGMKGTETVSGIQVSYHRLEDFILTWAMIPGNN
ncbi:MAG: 4'-phosphopantetheinyl transferase superfamily protein [Bacteroidia bacterium]|nr:4'-phosphopantetheinyl transferase superfamily protein [Bacteroidia bacterium]